jgi:hypothetical protein
MRAPHLPSTGARYLASWCPPSATDARGQTPAGEFHGAPRAVLQRQPRFIEKGRRGQWTIQVDNCVRPGPVVPDIGLLKPDDLELPAFDFENLLLLDKFPKPAMSNRH